MCAISQKCDRLKNFAVGWFWFTFKQQHCSELLCLWLCLKWEPDSPSARNRILKLNGMKKSFKA